MPRPLLIPAALVMFAATTAACTERAGTERAGTDRAAADTLPGVAGVEPDTASAGDSGCAPAPLADSAAGPVRIGMTVEALRARCADTRDSTGLADEGMTARTLLVPVGADTVAARIVEGRAWRLAVTSRGLRTRDSLGVGTPLARLLALPGAHGLVGEGRTFVVANVPCGLSFELSSGVRDGNADSAALRRLPASTVVRRVLVTGCGS